jgi:hypothetical protein
VPLPKQGQNRVKLPGKGQWQRRLIQGVCGPGQHEITGFGEIVKIFERNLLAIN